MPLAPHNWQIFCVNHVTLVGLNEACTDLYGEAVKLLGQLVLLVLGPLDDPVQLLQGRLQQAGGLRREASTTTAATTTTAFT